MADMTTAFTPFLAALEAAKHCGYGTLLVPQVQSAVRLRVGYTLQPLSLGLSYLSFIRFFEKHSIRYVFFRHDIFDLAGFDSEGDAVLFLMKFSGGTDITMEMFSHIMMSGESLND